MNYERPETDSSSLACDEHDKIRPPCVPIIDVFTRRLVSWKYCTPTEAGVDRVRAWETAGRCAVVDRGNASRLDSGRPSVSVYPPHPEQKGLALWRVG